MTTSSIANGGNIGSVRGGHADVPSILAEFGVGRYTSPMAQQYVFMIPRTTDPDAQGVIMLVEAVQRGLKRLNAHLDVSGILDQRTVDYLRQISGPSWHGKTWLQILGDLSDAAQRRVRFSSPDTGLSDYFVPTSGIEISTGAVVFLAIGSYFVYRMLRGRKCTTS
jgi:hypothetical protein